MKHSRARASASSSPRRARAADRPPRAGAALHERRPRSARAADQRARAVRCLPRRRATDAAAAAHCIPARQSPQRIAVAGLRAHAASEPQPRAHPVGGHHASSSPGSVATPPSADSARGTAPSSIQRGANADDRRPPRPRLHPRAARRRWPARLRAARPARGSHRECDDPRRPARQRGATARRSPRRPARPANRVGASQASRSRRRVPCPRPASRRSAPQGRGAPTLASAAKRARGRKLRASGASCAHEPRRAKTIIWASEDHQVVSKSKKRSGRKVPRALCRPPDC